MAVEDLLADLEEMTHSQRVVVMLELGRQGDDASRALIGELERGGFYERSLALYSCFGSRDHERIVRALADPSRLLRGLATQLAALFCDDAQALRALELVAPPARLALAHKLRRRRRLAVIDAYLASDTLSASVFTALLPLASEQVARQRFTRFATQATNDDWRRLARSLPALAFAELERQIRAATQRDGRLVARVNNALAELAAADPDRALALVAMLAGYAPFESVALQPLIARRPSQTASLILAQTAIEWRQWSHTLALFRGSLSRLNAEQIIALYNLNPQAFGWGGAWIKEVDRDERVKVYKELRTRLMRGARLSVEMLAALPAQDRASEARAVVAMSRLAPNTRLSYATYLPWDEMLDALRPGLRAPDANTRQVALVALIAAVAFHRERLGDVLAELRERRNEQDGVRRAMFEALRKLPPSVWSAERLTDVEELIRHGLNDVGLSAPTANEIGALLLRVAASHPAWAGAQLAQMALEHGPVAPSVAGRLDPMAEMELARALTPLLRIWAEHGDDLLVLETVKRQYERPAAFALAVEYVEAIIRQTHQRATAESALSLLAARAPARFATLAPELIARDPSWYTFHLIAAYLFRRRQDLLTPFLAYRTYSGRWDTGRQRSLPHLSRPFAGGTARQQERLAGVALEVIANRELDSRVTTEAIRLLGLLPAVPAERITPLASDDRPLVRTTALFTLARLDTDGGLDTLLDALDDERARIAVHALRRFLVVMPTARALDILRAIPLDRVTVAKEVMRLTSELAPDAAFDELLALERRDLHRDVRIALLRTLNAYLNRPQTWEILQRAAASPDQEVALATLSLTTLANPALLAEVGELEVQRRALDLIGALLARPEREARAQVMQYCARFGLSDHAHDLAPSLIAYVEAGISPTRTRAEYDEAFTALAALFGVCAPNDSARIARLTRALLPHRRLLLASVNAMIAAPRLQARGLEPVIRGMVVALARDPNTTRLRMRLVMPHLQVRDIVRLFNGLARTRELRADDLMFACEQFEKPVVRFNATPLVMMEDAWRGSRNESIRRLAFAVLRGRAHTAGEWSAELLARLRAYRSDRSPLVASAAQFTFPFGDAPEDGDLA